MCDLVDSTFETIPYNILVDGYSNKIRMQNLKIYKCQLTWR